ncbi:MAG: TonB-dependent receptor [Chloroflexia bacterium]|nr:TonB-dependent receptor [Chloroflexia bacterium]
MERRMEDFMIFGAAANNVNKEFTNQGNVNATYSVELSEKINMNLSSGYHAEKWELTTVLLPQGFFGLTEDFLGGPYLISYGYDFNLDLNYKLLDNNTLLIGATYMNEGLLDVENQMTHNPITLEFQGELMPIDGFSFNEEKERNVFGAYIQDQHKIGDYLKITAGARFDNYDDFGSSFNPRVALVYNTPIKSVVKAMYGTAFRAPNFLELYDKTILLILASQISTLKRLTP